MLGMYYSQGSGYTSAYYNLKLLNYTTSINCMVLNGVGHIKTIIHRILWNQLSQKMSNYRYLSIIYQNIVAKLRKCFSYKHWVLLRSKTIQWIMNNMNIQMKMSIIIRFCFRWAIVMNTSNSVCSIWLKESKTVMNN